MAGEVKAEERSSALFDASSDALDADRGEASPQKRFAECKLRKAER